MSTNLLQSAATWLGQKLQGSASMRIAGRTITYQTGSREVADIIGWVASKDYEIVGGDSYPLSITSFDWTVFAADIAISAVTIAPRDGDRIAETINGVQNTYELMPVGKRKCCEWFDTSGLMLTLHTKLIKSE